MGMKVIQLSPVALSLMAAVAPSQSRQFEVDSQRAIAVFLPGRHLDMAFGDVDGDGDLDAVVAGVDPWFGTGFVSLLRQQPGGTWPSTGLHAVPGFAFPYDRMTVALVDLDGDGALDVVAGIEDVAGAIDTRVVCMRNDGAGTFAPGVTLALPGASSASFAVADVDGDADRDVVIAAGLGGASVLQWFAHDGAFGFQAVANAFPAVPARMPAAFDFDGDGDPDVAAIGVGGEVLMFTNDNGAFTAAVLDPVPTASLVGGDLDGDGDGDLIAQRVDGSIAMLRNVAGALVAQTLAAAGIEGAPRPRLADFDGDLDLDVAVSVDYTVRLLRNDGAGAFVDEVVAPATGFAVGDADQDGVNDLLLQIDPGVVAALGRPAGMLVDPALSRRIYVAQPSTGYVDDVADFGGDHTTDVLQQTYYQVLLRRNLGVNEWSTTLLPVPFLRPHSRAVDVDGDSDLDIVVVNSDGVGGLQVFRDEGGPGFVPQPLQALPGMTILGKGDFNGDGRGDLLLSDWASLQIVSGTAAGAMSAPVTVFTDDADWADTGIWDFDGDGDLDLLVKLPYPHCVLVLANDGLGNFGVADPCVASLPSPATTNMVLVDIDSDGDVDIFSCGYGSGRLLLNGGGVFSPGPALNGVESSALLKPHFADWDGDGDIDLLQVGGTAQLWLNDGSGGFVQMASTRIFGNTLSAAGSADLDGDGDLDPLGVLGFLATHRMNHLRSATSTTRVGVGGQMSVRYANEPGFATGNAICIPILSLDRRSTPLVVPGFEGTLQIDLLQSVMMPFLVLPAPGGIDVSTFVIPNAAHLLGVDLYAQGLILTDKVAWTPAIHERIL